MHPYFHIFGKEITGYGLFILIGVAAANLAALPVLKRRGKTVDDLILLELWALGGGVLTSKLFYLFLNRNLIDWGRVFTDKVYFLMLMRGGWVFFGGLLGGLLFLFLGGKVMKIAVLPYLEAVAFAIPLAHAFGRIGCFMGGCCYGIPHEGFLSVTFTESLVAPNGVPLLAVQLIESVCLFALALAVFLVGLKKPHATVVTYLAGYSVIRFIIEFFRYDDAERGVWFGLSTSQYVSLGVLAAMAVLLIRHLRGRKDRAA